MTEDEMDKEIDRQAVLLDRLRTVTGGTGDWYEYCYETYENIGADETGQKVFDIVEDFLLYLEMR